MKTMRRISIGVMAFIMAIGMSVSVFAAGGSVDSKSEALSIALNNVGIAKSQAKNIEVDKEKKHYDVEFTKKSNGTEFDFEIAIKDGKILEKCVEHKYKKSKSKKKIGKTKARKIVAKASGTSYNVVKKGTCKYTYKEKEGKYKVKFRTTNYKYEYELKAPNGKIIEWEYEYIGTR